MTTAEQIAFLMNNDGTTFEIGELELEDLCETEAVFIRRDSDHGQSRFVFADDSAITISGDAWDVGYPECFCWQSEGHTCYTEE